MSADNYYLISKVDGRFLVQMGFDSDSGIAPHPCDQRFGTLEAAVEYASGQYSEYGVRFDKSVFASLSPTERTVQA